MALNSTHIILEVLNLISTFILMLTVIILNYEIYVQFAENVCTCEMLFLACIKKHTSTMSPVNEAQNYEYYHQNKGIQQIWNFRDDVCVELRVKRL